MTAQNFHNISDAALADIMGELDTRAKMITADLDTYKTEFKRRGLSAVRGERFTVTTSISISKRLDTKKLRAALDDLDGYEIESTSTRVLIKPIAQLADAAE